MALNMDADGTVILNGPQGITGTPKNSTFVIGFILILLTLFIVQNLINSRDGRAIMAIRDNRIAAESIGINITKYKLMAFTISAAMAGAAGVLYAHNISTLTANTNNFGYNMSITILVFVVLGGIGNIRGSIIAAVILKMCIRDRCGSIRICSTFRTGTDRNDHDEAGRIPIPYDSGNHLYRSNLLKMCIRDRSDTELNRSGHRIHRLRLLLFQDISDIPKNLPVYFHLP